MSEQAPPPDRQPEKAFEERMERMEQFGRDAEAAGKRVAADPAIQTATPG